MDRDFQPLGRTVNHGDDVADFRRFERRAQNARLFNKLRWIMQLGKIKSCARAQILADLRRKLVLALDPRTVGRGNKLVYARTSQLGTRVSAQQIAEQIVFQRACAGVRQWCRNGRHRSHGTTDAIQLAQA
jgi:hypothetical protein